MTGDTAWKRVAAGTYRSRRLHSTVSTGTSCRAIVAGAPLIVTNSTHVAGAAVCTLSYKHHHINALDRFSENVCVDARAPSPLPRAREGRGWEGKHLQSRIHMLRCVVAWCSALRYVAVRCGTLLNVTVRYGVLRHVVVRYVTLRCVTVRYVTLRYVAMRYGTLRRVAVRYGALRHLAAHCGALLYATMRCSALRCVTLLLRCVYTWVREHTHTHAHTHTTGRVLYLKALSR